MPDLNPLEPGVMFWAGRDDLATIRSMGVRCGQLGVSGEVDLSDVAAAEWKRAIGDDFTVISVIAAYDGEDYADIPTVKRTVGFIPPSTREQRERRTMEMSDFAARLGVGGIGCHIGFVP